MYILWIVTRIFNRGNDMSGNIHLPDEKRQRYSFYKVGTRVFSQGDKSTEIYILKKGAVTVCVDDQIVGLINTPDTFIGEMAYYLGIPRTATVEAVEDSEFIVIPAEDLYENVLKHPDIGIELIKILSERLANTTKYATRLEKDLVETRAELRKIKGIREEPEPSIEDKLISRGFITGEQLNECRKESKQIKDAQGISLLHLLIKKNYLTVEKLIQFLELEQV
jgi:CRP-like cAMP-binding protein